MIAGLIGVGVVLIILGFVFDSPVVIVGGGMIIFGSLIIISVVDQSVDSRDVCRDYCNEEGYKFNGLETNDDVTYCLCDTSVSAHEIVKTRVSEVSVTIK